MSDLERHVRENWSRMSPSERMFAMMDLGEENGVKPITVDDWMKWVPEPSDFDVLEPCEDDTAQYQKTNFIPPTWASEMMKDKPAVMFLDEYRIENGRK